MEKPILLVDEGTSNLDQENAKKIEKLLLQINRKTVLVYYPPPSRRKSSKS